MKSAWFYAFLWIIGMVVAVPSATKVELHGIEPNAGPLSGGTRVLVRGTDFTNMDTLYPNPKWRFGRDDKIVSGSYIKCTPEPKKIWEMEPPTSAKTLTCIQCEMAPPGFKSEIIPFTVSLTGDFSDISNSLSYRYYTDVVITAIYPKYGEKDGGTKVEVWGEHFLNFDQFTRCGFGSKTVPAVFVNSNYMYWISPPSDVIEQSIPFIITLNGQQNSKDKMKFWYYNKPSIRSISPNKGPEDGGNEIIINGNNFDPFRFYDISNYNDTFCNFEGLKKMPATVIDSTKISWNAPSSFKQKGTVVEVTLNNQQYTDDKVAYSYYTPPYVFDIDPRQGPIKGNTEVTLTGTNFKENSVIKCMFGDQIIEGKFVTVHKVKCVSPPHGKAEFVPIKVSFEKDLWSSGQIKYLYYDQPSIKSIEPSCGPESGYTQITVYGANFVNLGIGKVHWVFNNTVHMNATVIEHDIIKCDSPPVKGLGGRGTKFYDLQITLDGTMYGGPPQRFTYYKDPELIGITPTMGPIDGGTEISIFGSGFKQPASWNMTVKFGNLYTRPIKYTDSEIKLKTPPIDDPDIAEISVALNGQQFIHETDNYSEDQNIFYYYDSPTIFDFKPERGLSNGGTVVRIRGKGFLPKRYENGAFVDSPVFVRMLESKTFKALGPTVEAEYVTDEVVQWTTPPAPAGTKGIISLSLNNHQFLELYRKGYDYAFEYLSSPIVNSIDPEFGEVKHSQNTIISVHGQNFDWENDDWSSVKCRFGEDPDAIVVKGKRVSTDLIQCPLPNYPQPEILDVEVSVNGVDFSNDKKQFGFYDPFVLHASPILISTTGSTKLEIKGFGFVDSSKYGKLKALYDNDAGEYYWSDDKKNKWVMDAKYVDKNKLIAQTVPMDTISTKSNKKVKAFDPINVEISVYDDKFTSNHIKVYYYEEPEYSSTDPQSASANLETSVFIETDFKSSKNNMELFTDYGNFKWRFSSVSRSKVMYADGEAVTYPFQAGADPTHIKWDTPIWPLNGSGSGEKVKLDVTWNGYDYSGNFDFTFTNQKSQNRASNGVSTYKSAGYKISNNKYVDSSATQIPNNHRNMNTQDTFNLLSQKSPFVSSKLNFEYNKDGLSILENRASSFDHPSNYITLADNTYYKQPTIKNIHPHGGPLKGGTPIVIEGADFEYLPEYGIIPHCQIGDKIVEAKFESTVRIICTSPPGTDIDSKIPIKISNNGEAFTETGKYFHYYKDPEIKGIQPTSGPSTGGTTVRITGDQFSDLSYEDEFLCRFQPLNRDIPPKTSQANYLNSNTIICTSPSGFGNVDSVNVDLSLNGVDFYSTNQIFRYYTIITYNPKSGPTDGSGQSVKVIGQGFKDDGNIKCRLDKTEYKPIKVSWTEITCPVVPAKQGLSFFGKVPFDLSINGEEWHSQPDGYYYYEQPTITDIYPKSGPSVGHGKVKISGSKFRSDFSTSAVAWKVGDYYGNAKVINSNTLEWELPYVPLTSNESRYLAQVSLNNNTWTDTNSNIYYVPYGIDHITPNSGPSIGGTDITVFGTGFSEANRVSCRFGISGDYTVVTGKALSSDKLIWRSPVEFNLPRQSSFPFSVPFSIALNEEEYNPWTENSQRFRFYEQPVISKWTPRKIEMGTERDVYVFSNENTEFIEPIPIQGVQYTDYGIMCKFGVYGTTQGSLVNSTLIRCPSPTDSESPENIDMSYVILSVALNSQNFNDNESQWEFTFTGTGTTSSFWPWIIGILLALMILIFVILCIAAIVQRNALTQPRRALGPNYEREAPHVLNKRPRGVPVGPMVYDTDFRAERSLPRGTDRMTNRPDMRANDPNNQQRKRF